MCSIPRAILIAVSFLVDFCRVLFCCWLTGAIGTFAGLGVCVRSGFGPGLWRERGAVIADLSTQIGRDRKAFVGLSASLVLLKKAFAMMFDAALARHYAVGRGRALDFGRATLEAGDFGTLLGIKIARTVD